MVQVLVNWHLPASGDWFNIMMSFSRYYDIHYRYKTVVRPSYHYNGNSYTGGTISLYWIKVPVINIIFLLLFVSIWIMALHVCPIWVSKWMVLFLLGRRTSTEFIMTSLRRTLDEIHVCSRFGCNQDEVACAFHIYDNLVPWNEWKSVWCSDYLKYVC